jgi:hypothetical protein
MSERKMLSLHSYSVPDRFNDWARFVSPQECLNGWQVAFLTNFCKNDGDTRRDVNLVSTI